MEDYAKMYHERLVKESAYLPCVRLSSLTDDWFNRQVGYQKIASEKEDARHAARFNGKSQATRDCWKELQRLIENEA